MALAVVTSFLESRKSAGVSEATRSALVAAAKRVLAAQESYDSRSTKLRLEHVDTWTAAKSSFVQHVDRCVADLQRADARSACLTINDAWSRWRDQTKIHQDPSAVSKQMQTSTEARELRDAKQGYTRAVNSIERELEAAAASSESVPEDVPWAVRLLATGQTSGDEDDQAQYGPGVTKAVIRDSFDEPGLVASCAGCGVLIQVGIKFGRGTKRFTCMECKHAQVCTTCHEQARRVFDEAQGLQQGHQLVLKCLSAEVPHVVPAFTAESEGTEGATAGGCWLCEETQLLRTLSHRVNGAQNNDSFARRVMRAFDTYGTRPCYGLVSRDGARVEWLSFDQVKPTVRRWSTALAGLCRKFEEARQPGDPPTRCTVALYVRSSSATYLAAMSACVVAQGRVIGCDAKWAHADAVAGLAAAAPDLLVCDTEAAAALASSADECGNELMGSFARRLKSVVVIDPVHTLRLGHGSGETPTPSLQEVCDGIEKTAAFANIPVAVADSAVATGEDAWPDVPHIDLGRDIVVGMLTSGSSGGKARKGVWRTLDSVTSDIPSHVGAFPSPLATYLYYSPSWSTGFNIAWATMLHGGRLALPATASAPPLPWDGMKLTRPTSFVSLVPQLVSDLLARLDQRVEDITNDLVSHGETPSRACSKAYGLAAHAAFVEDLGGRTSMVGCGGAIVPLPDLLRLGVSLPLDVSHGYGATEGGAIGRASDTPGMLRPAIGAVTKLESHEELGYTVHDKPHPRGELLVKTPGLVDRANWLGCSEDHIASRYDADGYYRTSDIVEWHIATDEFRIIDRVSASIKLPSGSFFTPSQVEEAVRSACHPPDVRSLLPVGAVGPTATILQGKVVVFFTLLDETQEAGTPLLDPETEKQLLGVARRGCKDAGLASSELPDAVIAASITSQALTPSMKHVRSVVLEQLTPAAVAALARGGQLDEQGDSQTGGDSAGSSIEYRRTKFASDLLEQLGLRAESRDQPLRDIGLDSTLAAKAMVLLRSSWEVHAGRASLPPVRDLPDLTAQQLAARVVCATPRPDERPVRANTNHEPTSAAGRPQNDPDKGVPRPTDDDEERKGTADGGGDDLDTVVKSMEAEALKLAQDLINADRFKTANARTSILSRACGALSLGCHSPTAGSSDDTSASDADGPPAVVVTGATGFLGRHVVAELLEHTSYECVCLVRAADAAAAQERVLTALQQASNGSTSGVDGRTTRRLHVIATELTNTKQLLDALASSNALRNVRGVIHVAAKVRSWDASPHNTRDLSQHNVVPTAVLAAYAASRSCPLLYASTHSVVSGIVGEKDAVASVSDDVLPRCDFTSHYDAYGLTKLLGEAVAIKIMNADLSDQPLGGNRVCVSRLPLLTPSPSGDRNEEDWVHRCVASSAAIGVYPHGGLTTHVSYTAVDVAARALIDRFTSMMDPAGDTSTRQPVVHIHDTRRVNVGLLLEAVFDGQDVAPVNPAAFRYTLTNAKLITNRRAAAFLPLEHQLAKGAKAFEAWTQAQRAKPADDYIQHTHEQLLNSLRLFAKNSQ